MRAWTCRLVRLTQSTSQMDVSHALDHDSLLEGSLYFSPIRLKKIIQAVRAGREEEVESGLKMCPIGLNKLT